VALVILLIGAYVALRIFPAGFAAIERARQESLAARLADQEVQRWQLAAGSLPEAIVWADSSSGSLIYNVNYAAYDPTDPLVGLRPNWDNPNWQPDSLYKPRTIIGEVLPIGEHPDPTTGVISVPLCRLRFGPLVHLYDNPANGDPLFVYTTQYQRADTPDLLVNYTTSGAKDWGRYYVNYRDGSISFDYVPDAASAGGYDRRFRVEFTYLTAAGPGAPAERRYDMWQTTYMITVPADYDSTRLGSTRPPPQGRQGPLSLFGAGGPPPGFEGVVPASERVHQALIFDGTPAPSGPGHFTLDKDVSAPDCHLLFAAGDAGRTVHVDYRARDWQILLEERVPDESLQVQLVLGPLKNAQYKNPPRQPDAPDRLIPGDDAMVIILDTDDGSRLSGFTVDYATGLIDLAGATRPDGAPAAAGRTYRIYYRSELDWAIQPMKAAAEYSVLVGDTEVPTYRSAVWVWDRTKSPPEPTNQLLFGRCEVAKSIVANYYMYTNPGSESDPEPRLVAGDLKPVTVAGDQVLIALSQIPRYGLRVRGASLSARVLWAGRGRIQAAGSGSPPAGTDGLSPESWRQVKVETFLRRQ